MVMLCLNESTDPETTSMKSKDGKHYTKEDLMWEAVRRNENYREYYRRALTFSEKSGSKEEIPQYHVFHHSAYDSVKLFAFFSAHKFSAFHIINGTLCFHRKPFSYARLP